MTLTECQKNANVTPTRCQKNANVTPSQCQKNAKCDAIWVPSIKRRDNFLAFLGGIDAKYQFCTLFPCSGGQYL